jgi:hypothetical protein
MVAKRSAAAERTQTINQASALVLTAALLAGTFTP